MPDPYFFGYGSLVNAATHSYPDTRPTQLAGWRRMWRHTKMRDVAYLTAIPDPGCRIAGLIARVPDNDWAALDQREYAYSRDVVELADLESDLTGVSEVQIYQTHSDRDAPPDIRHPILMSYLDVVVQGYLRVFGKDGVAEFFATTSGWEAPIQNDRAAPIYPRAQTLTEAETALVDHHLRALSAHVK